MLKLSLIGLLLVVVTVAIHAIGTTQWVRLLGRRYRPDSHHTLANESLRPRTVLLDLPSQDVLQCHAVLLSQRRGLPDRTHRSQLIGKAERTQRATGTTGTCTPTYGPKADAASQDCNGHGGAQSGSFPGLRNGTRLPDDAEPAGPP